jgi:hypothetical protein
MTFQVRAPHVRGPGAVGLGLDGGDAVRHSLPYGLFSTTGSGSTSTSCTLFCTPSTIMSSRAKQVLVVQCTMAGGQLDPVLLHPRRDHAAPHVCAGVTQQ